MFYLFSVVIQCFDTDGWYQPPPVIQRILFWGF